MIRQLEIELSITLDRNMIWKLFGVKMFLRYWTIEGFHVTSQQPNRASHAIHSHHVGSFFALSGIGKSHKICSHSLLLNLHKAKLHRSNSVVLTPCWIFFCVARYRKNPEKITKYAIISYLFYLSMSNSR